MMEGAALRSWKNIKHHVPLIKFKKGGPFSANSAGAAAAPAGGSKKGGSKTGKNETVQLPVIEDWQLPPNYQRAKLDQKEIDAINSGGAY